MDGYAPTQAREYECVDSFSEAFTPGGVSYAPDTRGHFTADVFAQAAERIQRSLRGGLAKTPAAIASMVADTIEQASGVRIHDQARLARQLMLWEGCCPPARARELTLAALADRAGALRRSAALERTKGCARQ